MKIHHIAANRYHLSIIKPTEHGYVIAPHEHCLQEHPNELFLEGNPERLGICQDEQQFIHMVYIDHCNMLIHAVLHPRKYTLQLYPMERNADDVTDIQLGCRSNQLHLYLIYANRVEYRQLSGVHWSEPTILIESDHIEQVQLQMNDKTTTLGYTLRLQNSRQFCLLQYDHGKEEWLDPLTILEVNNHCRLFPLLASEVDATLHIVILQFYQGRLHLTYHQLDHAQRMLASTKSAITIPYVKVEHATFIMEGQQLRCIWVADHLLYQLHYQRSTSSWGPFKAENAESFVKWIAITENPSFGIITPYWFADSLHRLNERMGFGIDQYRSDRDFRQSLLFTERWMASAVSMIKQKEELLSEQQQLEQSIKMWKEHVAALKARLLILNEELAIRKATTHHTHTSNVDQKALVLASNRVFSPVQTRNEIITEAQSNVVPLDHRDDARKKSVKDKVVHFLFKITRNQ
ncbi:hypothetical protein [Paenibacillus guangzhouensis]|uniref:hypothetical protein n=1 Tax=Paenibacillus guangzhouensis TaxID=1473112 RepID=UPI00126774FF|nr:hypothetical protein [Paenibacillus guangzhouensis]